MLVDYIFLWIILVVQGEFSAAIIFVFNKNFPLRSTYGLVLVLCTDRFKLEQWIILTHVSS